MKRSDNIAELAAALAKAQGEFQAVPRSAENPFFKSKYADLPSVVLAASPILSKHGLSVSQLPDFDGESDLLTTTIMHESGQWIEASARLHLIKQEPQAQGSATTYMRRYAYSGGIGVVTEADDDAEAASHHSTSPAQSYVPAGVNTAPCPQCGKALRERTGANGPFVGCTGYPACKFTANGTLDQFQGMADAPPDDEPGQHPSDGATRGAQISALVNGMAQNDIRDAFKAAGASDCLAAVGSGWKIRGAEVARLSADVWAALVQALSGDVDPDEIPFP